MSNQVLQITDFRMAGFLIAHKSKFIGTVLDDRGDVVFNFNDSDNAATNILNTYPGSVEQMYDASCRTMHDFVKIATKRR